MNEEVNMRRYGGLRKVMPVTYVTFLAGYLAIIGIPPFSGFFTKDGIIEACFDKGGTSGAILGTAAIIGAAITGFYMTRMVLMTFMGKPRWEQEVSPERRETPEAGTAGAAPHPHESPAVMIWPMIVLAIGSVVVGGFLVINNRLANFLAPVIGQAPAIHALFNLTSLVTLAVVLLGVAGAWAMYGRVEVPAIAPPGRLLTRAARQDLYGDAFNESVLMRPGQWLTRLSVYFDNRGVDGLVNTTAALIGGTSGRWRRLQTGFVRSYALSMLAGGVILVALLLAVRL
jgi:NADH-quinone oxidoreductase subunit L